MNRKGFTLVELLAVIALVALLSGIAVTNVVSSINNSKKNTFLLDAKRMIAKAEYLLSEDVENRNKLKNGNIDYIIYKLDSNELNDKAEFQKDADDGEFEYKSTDLNKSFVAVIYDNNSETDTKEFKYCVCVVGSKRKITGSNGNCVIDNNIDKNSIKNQLVCKFNTSLTGINVVIDK